MSELCLTAEEKELVKANNLNPENWVKVRDGNEVFIIKSKFSDKTKVILKFKGEKGDYVMDSSNSGSA